MRIELNKDLDKDVYLNFYNVVVGGVNFGEKITNDHPEINPENYNKYIEDFYIKHKPELLTVLADTQLCFMEIKDVLLTELENYFGKLEGISKYSCFLLIFDCNPRYLEEGYFQVYYKRSYAMRKEVIAHELTHFVFYNFCHKLGLENDQKLWELSEIFNVLFLNIESIQKNIGAEELLFYPDLQDKLLLIKKIWQKGLPAKDFILKSLARLG